MRDLILSVEFWVAMLLAVLLKLRASPRMTLFQSLLTVAAAVGSALVFTAPVLDLLDLAGQTYTAAIAALVALTGEQIARQMLDAKLPDLIRAWRGGGK